MDSLRSDIVHRGAVANDLEAEGAIETARKITGLIKKFQERFQPDDTLPNSRPRNSL